MCVYISSIHLYPFIGKEWEQGKVQCTAEFIIFVLAGLANEKKALIGEGE